MLNYLFSEESGQGLAEYVVILTVVSIVAIALLRGVGQGSANRLDPVGNVFS